MVYLYVIMSFVNNDLYVGITKNISNRLAEHEKGKNRYTKGLRPWKLMYTEEFPNWQ